MSLNWTAVEDALTSWVRAGSGLGDAHVIIGEQTGPRPSDSAGAPFITIRLGDLTPVGGVDELETNYDSGQPAGQEIELRVLGRREMRVSVQAFTPSVVNSTSARALLSKVQTALQLPSVAAGLDAAALTLFDTGSVQNITALVGTKFESRAVLDVGFYVMESMSERTGYIATVDLTSYMGPPDQGTKDNIDI